MHTKSWLVWPALHKDTCHAHKVMADLICFAQKHSLYTQVAWHWVLHKKCLRVWNQIFVYLALTCTNTVHTQTDLASTPAHSTDLASIWPTHSTDLASFSRHTFTVTQHKQIWPILSGLHMAQTDLANCIWLAHSTNRSDQSDLACTRHKQIWPIVSGLHTAQTDLANCIWLAHSTNRSGQLYLACTQHKQIWPAYSTNRSGQLSLACTQHKQIWPIWSGLHTAQI